MFPPELEAAAFRAGNGEFGWTRAQVPQVVDTLAHRGFGILGGELWWVRDGLPGWIGLIPQRHGPPAVYGWTTERGPEESWADFVARCAAEARETVRRFPDPGDLPPDLPGRLLYNLTWASEAEYEALRSRTG